MYKTAQVRFAPEEDSDDDDSMGGTTELDDDGALVVHADRGNT
jgi:hypothetical protein